MLRAGHDRRAMVRDETRSESGRWAVKELWYGGSRGSCEQESY